MLIDYLKVNNIVDVNDTVDVNDYNPDLVKRFKSLDFKRYYRLKTVFKWYLNGLNGIIVINIVVKRFKNSKKI